MKNESWREGKEDFLGGAREEKGAESSGDDPFRTLTSFALFFSRGESGLPEVWSTKEGDKKYTFDLLMD